MGEINSSRTGADSHAGFIPLAATTTKCLVRTNLEPLAVAMTYITVVTCLRGQSWGRSRWPAHHLLLRSSQFTCRKEDYYNDNYNGYYGEDANFGRLGTQVTGECNWDVMCYRQQGECYLLPAREACRKHGAFNCPLSCILPQHAVLSSASQS